MIKALIPTLTLAAALSLACSPALATGKHRPGFCSATADVTLKACGYEVKDDYWIAVGNCINESDKSDRRECLEDAYAELAEGKDVCEEQHEARLELCDAVGERRYDPDFDPANFVEPTEIGSVVTPNEYFPLVPGNRWVYEAADETITVTVTDKTKLIEGVTCLVVNDLVTDEDGNPIEDTDDWYAQDLEGNVWYCGEIAQNFELFEGDDPEDAELIDVEGSWKTGRDYAKPGIQMFADPQLGKTYRQEVALGNAEDVAEIVALDGDEETDAADCDGTCVVTREYTPIEPDVVEFKYYATDVGLILEVNPETGERVELVEFTPGTP